MTKQVATCVCGHGKACHSEARECSGHLCGCIEFRDSTAFEACHACGGEGYTRTERGPCRYCNGREYLPNGVVPTRRQ